MGYKRHVSSAGTVKFNGNGNRLNKHDRKTPTRTGLFLFLSLFLVVYKPHRRNKSITSNDSITLFMPGRRGTLNDKLETDSICFYFTRDKPLPPRSLKHRESELMIKSVSKMPRESGEKFRKDFRDHRGWPIYLAANRIHPTRDKQNRNARWKYRASITVYIRRNRERY